MSLTVLCLSDLRVPLLKEMDLEEEEDTVRNISTTKGIIQLMIKDRRPFKVTGYLTVPTIEFADFRSNETYITVILTLFPTSIRKTDCPLLQVYVLWLHLLFNTIIPFIILLSMNTAIYRKLVSVSTAAQCDRLIIIDFLSYLLPTV